MSTVTCNTAPRSTSTPSSAPSSEHACKPTSGAHTASRPSCDRNPGREGGSPPSDFGHRSPDYNRDGRIDEHESRVYEAETRSETARYREDARTEVALHREESRERISKMKEESKNYRSEVAARTEQIKSQNDNKIHKMFGISPFHSAPIMPSRPDFKD